MANCLWNDFDSNSKYHLVNWESVAMYKEFGGIRHPQFEIP